MKKIMFYLSLFFLAASFFSLCYAKTGAGSEYEGIMVAVSGKVFADDLPAKTGMRVMGNAFIHTEEDSFCEIVFQKESVFRIYENTQVQLDFKGKMNNLSILKGTIASMIRKISELAEEITGFRYTVKTPTAIAGIRGTAFFIRVNSKDDTYICICNGIVHVTDIREKTKKTIRAKHHKAVRVIRTEKGRIMMEDADMILHTDAEMEALAELIGQRIDWERIDE